MRYADMPKPGIRLEEHEDTDAWNAEEHACNALSVFTP
jgi:hypothetical protein